MRDGELVIRSAMVHLGGAGATGLVVGGTAIAMILVCTFLRANIASRNTLREELEIRNWQLQQLLPATR